MSSASTTTFLKRKRPGRIDIPNEPLRFDSTPGDGERIDEVEAKGEGYAVYCKRGKRRAPMEDRHSAASGVLGDPKQVLYMPRKTLLLHWVVFVWGILLLVV